MTPSTNEPRKPAVFDIAEDDRRGDSTQRRKPRHFDDPDVMMTPDEEDPFSAMLEPLRTMNSIRRSQP
nr:hypothetical protein [Marinicella sp. W31]MDC2876716.1 hypothetical protein [Marinicella sp. W31]